MARLPEVLHAMRNIKIRRLFQTYKLRVGKDHHCLKGTYSIEAIYTMHVHEISPVDLS